MTRKLFPIVRALLLTVVVIGIAAIVLMFVSAYIGVWTIEERVAGDWADTVMVTFILVIICFGVGVFLGIVDQDMAKRVAEEDLDLLERILSGKHRTSVCHHCTKPIIKELADDHMTEWLHTLTMKRRCDGVFGSQATPKAWKADTDMNDARKEEQP